MSRRLGLIVGLNHYQDPLFRPLQFAENDARALAQWLVNEQGGKWSPGDVQLVQGEHVTKELIEPLIAQLCIQNAEPGDMILIYFAGHAFVDERNGEGYLALTNTRYQNSSTGLRLLSFVQQILLRSRATQIVLMLDCFQTGPAWSMQRSAPFDFKPLLGSTLLNTLQQLPDRIFLCSCRGNELAPESGERGLGSFAHRLIIGLCGPAKDPQSGTQTLQQLHSYLLGTLREQQRPQIFGQGQQPVILAGQELLPAPPMANRAPQAAPFSSGTPAPSVYSSGTFANTGYAPAQTMTQTPPPASRQSGQWFNAEEEQQRQQRYQQLLMQAQQQAQAQLFLNALESVEQALQLQPQSIAALTLKGQLLGTMGRLPEALTSVEQILQIEPQNALAWSMRAVLLNNIGQFKAAEEAIERSLELDANNPESYAIKTNIMGSMAAAQSQKLSQAMQSSRKGEAKSKNPANFFLSSLILIAAFLLSVAGVALLVLQPALPALLGLITASLGLATLCVWSARGTFRFGVVHLLPTILLSLIAGGLVAALYKLGYARLLASIQNHPNLLIPIVLLAAWLVMAAILPLPFALGGLIGGGISKARARAR
jgi:tetratricopeptide (TPR) repeat protein